MKLEVTEPNYAAQVVRVGTLLDLPNADRMHGIPFFGMQILVRKGQASMLRLIKM